MQLDVAITNFEAAVALDTTFALAYFDLAKAHKSRSVYGEARTNTERAWRWRSRLSIQDRMRLEAWREVLYYRPVAGIDTYRELHSRWPDDRTILEELSLQLIIWWFGKDLLTVTTSGMDLFPDDPKFVMYHEYALTLLSRPQEALAGARDLVSRFPDNSNHWDELGLRFIDAGLPDSAEVAFREAVARGAADSKWPLAALPYYRGDLDAALRSMERYLRNEDLSADAKYRNYMHAFTPLGYARVLYESGRYHQMLDIVDEAGRLRTDPVDQFYHQRYRCRDYLLRLGRVSEVVRWFDTEVAALAAGGGAAVDNPQLEGIARRSKLDFRARTLVAMDSLDAGSEAVEALAASASEFGNYYRLNALRLDAQIALKRGDADSALEKLDVLADDAVGEGMFRIDYLEMRAEANRLGGRFEEAVAVHQDLLKVFGGHALSHYELGLIYEDMKQPAAAARQYRRFLEMWANADEGLPQLADARQRLAELQ